MFETAVWMPTDVAVKDVVDVAVAAEAEGFDYFLVPDEGMTRDVFVTLTSIAEHTERIKFGPAIVNPYTRHPVASAVSVATLDELSGGRAFMGYGIGGSLVLGPMGYEIKRPLKICREAIEITRRMFAGEKVNYKGDFFNVSNAYVHFDVREIPIYFASRGPKMMELGGELTDGQFLSGKAKFDLQRTKDTILKGAAKTSRNPQIFYAAHIAYNEQIVEDVKANYTYMIVDSPEYIQRKLGLSADQIEEIRSTMIAEGIRGAAKFITPELLENFIIMGDDEVCAAEIAQTMKQYEFQVFTLPVPAITGLEPMISRISSIIKSAKEIYSQ
jgi:5,10-methylenetetrahydromethanopterin reductase